MPERENRAISGFVNIVEVGVADRLPSEGSSDKADHEVSSPRDQPGLDPLPAG